MEIELLTFCPIAITNDVFVEKLLIGLSDEGHEGSFTWLSDQAEMASPVEFCPGQPDNLNGNEHCAEINFCPGKINDLPCDISQGFICQLGTSILWWISNFSHSSRARINSLPRSSVKLRKKEINIRRIFGKAKKILNNFWDSCRFLSNFEENGEIFSKNNVNIPNFSLKIAMIYRLLKVFKNKNFTAPKCWTPTHRTV